MKNILLLKGSGIYDAMRTYIDELAKGFRKSGYNTIVLDFEKSNLGERLEWIIDTYPLYAVLIVNNAIDRLRERVELPGTVCVNYYCDDCKRPAKSTEAYVCTNKFNERTTMS